MPSKRTPHNPFMEFSGPDEERLHLKQRLAAAFRIFGRFGFDEGVAGHITARDPEHADRFWVNPFGMNFKQITRRRPDLRRPPGEVVDGTWPVNQAAFAIHSQVHAARPDVIAAAHSHSVYGKSFSTLGKKLDPITQDACIFFEDHAVYDDYTGVVNDVEEGKKLAHALGEGKAAILRNHGLLTVGHTRRRGRLLVHHDGAQLPGRAAGPGRRRAGADRRRRRPPDLHPGRQPPGRLVQRAAAVRLDPRRPSPTCCRAPSWSRDGRRPRLTWRHLTRGSSGGRQPRWTGRCASGSSSRPSTRSGRTPRSRCTTTSRGSSTSTGSATTRHGSASTTRPATRSSPRPRSSSPTWPSGPRTSGWARA